MYHPGKILKVLSPSDKNIVAGDLSTQALVEMWDENIFTLLVHMNISKEIKENDIVLIDYMPTSSQNPRPKQVITKILRAQRAKEMWGKYKDYHRKMKGKRKTSMERNAIYAG